MVLKDNRKGYMLVEIILAFAIAFAISFVMIELTINLKNKNEDVLVETLTVTDQTIIMNKLTEIINNEGSNFDCTKLNVTTSSIAYNGTPIDIPNEYIKNATKDACNKNGNKINITISLTVKGTGEVYKAQLNQITTIINST